MPAIEPLPGRRLYQVAEPKEPPVRTPPHNIEAEQALLGALLVNNDAFDRVSDFLRPEHFSEELHRRIFEVCAQLIRAGKLATVVTLKTYLGAIELPEGVTMQGYLARLAAEATTIINAEDYGRTIHDLAVRRDLINIGEEVVNTAFELANQLFAPPANRGSGAQALCYRRNGTLRRRLSTFCGRTHHRHRHGQQRLSA